MDTFSPETDQELYKEIRRAFLVSVYAGEIMLRNGAETTRVEDTINIMLKSFGITYGDCVVTPTGMFVSGYLEGLTYPVSLTRRVRTRGINFTKIVEVNDLSRRVALGVTTLAEAEAELEKVDKSPHIYPFWVLITAGAGSAGGATLLLGGGLLDSLVAFFSTILVQLLIWLVSRSNTPNIFGEFFGAAFSTAVALGLDWAGLPIHTTLVIAGGIVKLVPGAILLASVQDGIAGNLISSASRGLETILKGAALATGVGLSINASIVLGFTLPNQQTQVETWQIPIQIAAAFFAATLYSINVLVPRSLVLVAGMTGAFCLLINITLLRLTNTELVSIFIAALLTGIVSGGFARWQHSPVSVYILPGVFALLPGITIYNGMLSLAQQKTLDGLFYLIHAVFISGALGAGVALSNSVAPAIWRRHRLPFHRQP